MFKMKNELNRRTFLQTTTLAGAGMAIPFTSSAKEAPNIISRRSKSTINIGVIGVGLRGSYHAQLAMERDDCELVAICDVDKKQLARGVKTCAGQGLKVDTYHDFREMVARDDIDIVSVVTPPHWHALQAVAAAEAGKDVWCEKPMTRTIGEGRKVIEACKRNGTIFRINTWFRLGGSFYGSGVTAHDIKKVVRSGLLGGPLTVTIGKHQGFNWKIDMWSGKTNLPPMDIPKELDYDFWLGPAPKKPYHSHRVHASFRGYWDYDGGGLGDMGMHYLDPVQYFLDKDHTAPDRKSVV